MQVSIDSTSDIVVIRIAGDFLSDNDQAAFRGQIHDLVKKGSRLFLVDLGDVTYINSCGLGSLVGAYTTAKKAGGDVQLARAGSHVTELLATTRLDKVFKLHPTFEQARAHLSPQPKTAR